MAEDKTSEWKRLRAEMGEELFRQYFPNEAEEEQSWVDAKANFQKLRDMNKPRWKKNKVDTTDWKI